MNALRTRVENIHIWVRYQVQVKSTCNLKRNIPKILIFQLLLLLQKSDVTSTLELLKRCSRFYHSGELTADCLNNPRPCVRVPRECITHNAVYTILHYLTDHDFMSPRNVSAHQAPQFFA